MSNRVMETGEIQRLRFQLVAAEFLARMGARIRERRDELGLSRAEVARQMPGKVSENQIYRWEKGQHQPQPDTLEALAAILERDVAYFMASEPDKSETPDALGALSRTREIEATLADLAEQVRLLRAETAARDAEVLKRIDEALPPKHQSQDPPPQ